MKRILISVLFIGLIQACGTQQIKNDINYETDLGYPQETENFVVKDIHVYDDPFLGAALTWIDPRYPSDNITLYVYPVPKTDWSDVNETLSEEMDRVYEAVKYSVEQGKYTQVEAEEREAFAFEEEGEMFSGLKSAFNTYLENDRKINSNAYLFIIEDKFVKFRTSFDALLTPDWNGDNIVKELLPVIEVPPESEYVRNIRAQHREVEEQQSQELIKLLLEAIEKNGEEE